MPRIFLSYRREDAAGHAGRLYDRLIQKFGDENVFRDIDTIAPGTDFVDYIESAIAQADVTLALIGTDWLTVTDAAGIRRLDDPEDYVRLELSAALRSNILVIPVLVRGAVMAHREDLPNELRPLTRRNALTLPDQQWNLGVTALLETLEDTLSGRSSKHKRSDSRRRASDAEMIDGTGELIHRAKRVWTVRVSLGGNMSVLTFETRPYRDHVLRIDGREVDKRETAHSGWLSWNIRSTYEFLFPDDESGLKSTIHVVYRDSSQKIVGLEIIIANQVVLSEGIR